jgi:hypothetical protein
VLGRHVESLNFIELMLGDKAPLSPVQSFYQRILASDPDEVAYQAETLLKTMPLQQYYEEVALPALAMAQVDVTRGVLETKRQVEVCDSVERVVADLADHVDVRDEEEAAPPVAVVVVEAGEPAAERVSQVLCLAGQTPLDQAAGAILAQLLERRNIATRLAGPDALTTSGIFALKREGIQAICILYLDHRKMASVRYSVRRLRKKFVNVPIVVCLWGSADLSVTSEAARADSTVSSLAEALDFCAKATAPEAAAESPDASPIALAAG